MTDDARAAFDVHDAFERRAGGEYALVGGTFDATVTPGSERCAVAIRVPTIDAAVVGETVGDAVADGWRETFERRLEDVHMATHHAAGATPTVRTEGEDLVVETTLTGKPGTLPDEAVAVIQFVDGTWFEGVIPGYEYVDAIQNVRNRGRRRADSE